VNRVQVTIRRGLFVDWVVDVEIIRADGRRFVYTPACVVEGKFVQQYDPAAVIGEHAWAVQAGVDLLVHFAAELPLWEAQARRE